MRNVRWLFVTYVCCVRHMFVVCDISLLNVTYLGCIFDCRVFVVLEF